MFHAAFYFFLLAGVKRACVRAAEITTDATGDGHFFTVVIAAFRAGEAFAGAFEFPAETAFVTFVNRRVGAVIRHAIVAVIPHVF